VLGQLVEGTGQGAPGREPILDLVVARLRGQVEREPEALARSRPDSIAAGGVAEHVAGDTE
jgi:hypothetical protein